MAMIIMIMMIIMMIGTIHYHGTVDAFTFPNNFDSFLEVLFEHAECEDFLSDNEWSAVALRDCKPYVCDFPRELCRRPAAKFQDESSNKCFKIPEKCLVAANGGMPLSTADNTNSFTDNGITFSNTAEWQSTATSTASLLSNTETPSTKYPMVTTDKIADICNLEQPQGIFCGFEIKVAYNRNNQRCEQFWFPGCRTTETNQNLFDTVEECIEMTRICKGTGKFVPFFTTRHPGIPISVETPLPPVPLVTPFMATTVVPAKITPTEPMLITKARPVRPQPGTYEVWGGVVNPNTEIIGPRVPSKPPQTTQPHWWANPSGAKMILGLISNSLSQFTGGNLEEPRNAGSFLHQIPQFLRLLQGG